MRVLYACPRGCGYIVGETVPEGVSPIAHLQSIEADAKKFHRCG